MEPRLKSAIRVKALIRRCDLAAIGVAVTARGDPDAGAILLKLNGRDCRLHVLAQTRACRTAPRCGCARPAPSRSPEAEADAYIARQRGRDPDLWVVEIESAAVETLLDMPILT